MKILKINFTITKNIPVSSFVNISKLFVEFYQILKSYEVKF